MRKARVLFAALGKPAMRRTVVNQAVLMATITLKLGILVHRIRVGFVGLTVVGTRKARVLFAGVGKPVMRRIAASRVVPMATITLKLAILVLRIRVGFAGLTVDGMRKARVQFVALGKHAQRRMVVSLVVPMATITLELGILVRRVRVGFVGLTAALMRKARVLFAALGRPAMRRTVVNQAVLMATITLKLGILVHRVRVGFASLTVVGRRKARVLFAALGKHAQRRIAVSLAVPMGIST